MLTITPALEAWGLDDFDLWPCARPEPQDRGLLLLGAEMTDSQIGLAVASLASNNQLPLPRRARRQSDVVAKLRELAAKKQLIAPGGLVVSDSRTGTVIRPGCCTGLEEWHDWLSVETQPDLWLGHDPAPTLTPVPGGYELRQDTTADATTVFLPEGELAGLLDGVAEHLAGFLDQIAPWAEQHGQGLGEQLARNLRQFIPADEHDR